MPSGVLFPFYRYGHSRAKPGMRAASCLVVACFGWQFVACLSSPPCGENHISLYHCVHAVTPPPDCALHGRMCLPCMRHDYTSSKRSLWPGVHYHERPLYVLRFFTTSSVLWMAWKGCVALVRWIAENGRCTTLFNPPYYVGKTGDPCLYSFVGQTIFKP